MSIIVNPVAALVLSSRTNNNAYFINNNVEIFSSPASICASENPANFVFSSSATTTASSVSHAYLLLRVNNVPPDDTVIIFSAATPGYFPTYTFSAVAEPRLNEFYSTATTPSRTTSQVADSLVNAMNTNQSFRQRFVATYSASTVTVTALNGGEKWNVDYAITEGNPSNFTLGGPIYSTNSNLSQSRKDWSLSAELYVGGVGNLGSTNVDRTYGEFVTEFDFTRKDSNRYSIDCAGAVKNHLVSNFPNYGIQSNMQYTQGVNNYWLVFSEKYDEFRNNFRRKFLAGQTPVRWMFNSSLPFDQENILTGYTVYQGDGTLTGDARKHYLTNQPSVKLHYPGSREYLSILSEGSTALWYWVDVNFVDGTSYTNEFTIQSTSVSSASGGCYTAMVTPIYISASTYDGKLIKNFKVRLVKDYLGADSVQGHDQYYEMVHDCDSIGQKQLCWHNSLGGYDTFVMNGETAEDMDRKISTFNIPVELNNDYVSYTTTDNIQMSKSYKVHSGFINKEHFDWLKDIFKSSDVRVLNEDEWQKIVITKGALKGISNDDLFKVEIEYEFALPENYIKK